MKMMAREGAVRTLWVPGHYVWFQQAALLPYNCSQAF